ncbi:MAG: lipopolysaccharide biosynthesis protein [Acidobacteriales bacterium 59-55]|nr:lipopolysaccharide biosynthesis protein [Terriglobales bacterium]ODU54039.1 MAG: lipopolysaccharide biosynthesis protein [Granulicella sp. SCN 62-9]OJV39764.1 MAG: lipopolysaccharide biosynthesis protein [Acidobacteriales bacterium 59-55]
MLGHRSLNLEDFTTILKRRGWIVLIPALILPIITYGISHLVQPRYVSQTLVLVEQQKVPDSYVKPVVTEDLSSRLASMKEQILSRSRLEPIIERFNLYGTSKMSMDDRIDAVRKNIGIQPIQSQIARSGGLPGFFISYQASDPRTAQLVCGEITSLFVNESISDRTASAEGTTSFLQAQLADAKRNLDDQDAKLARFQEENAGRLPGQEGANMNMLTTLNTQLDAATQALARLEQDKSYEEAMLAQQTAQSSSSGGSGGVAPQTQQIELEKLLAQEADLTSRYTDDYPDVVSVRRKIKELRAQMAKAPAPSAIPATSAPNRGDSLSVQQLRAQLRSVEQGIVQKKREQASLTSQIRGYQGRIQSSPAVQEQFKKVTRDYQTAQQFYDDLLNKMNQSKMATDLEKRQQGENFKVMDEPNLPEAPTFPNRLVFAVGGFAAGVALGLLVIAFLEYRDTAVRTERDIWAFTKLPTLAVIGFTGERDTVPAKHWWQFKRRQPDLAAGAKPLVNTGQ